MNNKPLIIAGIVAAALIMVGAAGLFIFLKPSSSGQPTTTTDTFGTGQTTVSTVTPASGQSDQTNQVMSVTPSSNGRKVFQIAVGPVSGAAFTQTFSPTTTLARYILQENGHVMDQAIDVPGSLPRAVSNTTIPGTQGAIWAKGASIALLQYIDDATVKTVALTFPDAATSSKSVTKPVQIQFLPNDALGVAVSPSGTQVAYLLAGSSGVDGYIANINGGNAKKLFSIALSQLLLTWPSSNTLLLSMKSAAGVPTMIFSVDVKTGNILSLIYAPGATALANAAFSYVLYQTGSTGAAPASYAHDTKTAGDIRLSFNPMPEKCVESRVSPSKFYCAVPQSYFDGAYVDNWHKGEASLPDRIVSFSLNRLPATDIIATPGGSDGGVSSDILEMQVSPDDKYLLFIKKQDRSLWGVRLTQ
jgi:hypothetical protein